MSIEICKWYNNADSPVLFMIDDLANVWVDMNGSGKIELGEDWGYGRNSKKSSFTFLNEVILSNYPNLKVTFFTPVGVRVGMIKNPTIKSISKTINCDEETKKFFRDIYENPRFEIAYHGTTHGEIGKTRNDFKQEWELFKNVEEAIQTIDKGKEIYIDVFGENPKGGKYCGYVSNDSSDISIDQTGFLWWCRYYNRGFQDGKECSIGGNDPNPITNFDIKMFGKNHIIDIPTTVDGGFLTGVLRPDLKTLKGAAKAVLKKFLIKRKLQQIEYLLSNKLVISIQEHIAPSRDDGRRQMPNIFDDKESLHYLFAYLKDKNVWYCTGTELAEYYLARISVDIKNIDEKQFYFNKYDKVIDKIVSVTSVGKFNRIQQPDGQIVEKSNNCFNVMIQKGKYKLLIKE